MKSLHISYDYSGSEWRQTRDFLAQIDASMLERLELDFDGRYLPADFMQELFETRWPVLRRLSVRNCLLSSFSGLGKPENTASLRTLSVNGAFYEAEPGPSGRASNSGSIPERILGTLPPTIKNLYLDRFDAPDSIGFLALLRILRRPEHPLRNLSFVAFPMMESFFPPTLQDSPDPSPSLEEMVKSAGEFEGLAKERGIRLDPPNFKEEAERILRERFENSEAK